MTKAKGLQGCGPRLSPGVTFSCPRECKKVNSHVGSWSPDGLLNVQRVITRAKTQCLEEFFIPLEIY